MIRGRMISRMKGLRSLLRRGLALMCAVLVGGAVVAAPAAPSYELSFWALMPGGTASGEGMHEAGKKVTLKATPEKGYVFAGWYEVDHGTASRIEGDVDFRTPTYSYVMPPSNIVICAEFVPVTNDVAQISPLVGAAVVSEVACTPKAEIEPIVLDVFNCKSLPTVKVKGLPPGMKFTAKKFTNSDGTVLKANTVYGAPTKSGVYEMSATVTTATKKTATTTVTFVVVDREKGERVLRIAYDNESGKVSGAGVYAAGKKVTLKATPAKGYIFAGWYADADFETPLAGDVDFRTPSYPYVMPAEDITLFARFVPADEDAAALHLPPVAPEYAPNEAVELSLDVSGCVSLPTVKVAGLPPGLKFAAKALDVKATKTAPAAHYAANTIYGAPTKSGVYAATVTVTTAGKKTVSETVLFAVVDRDRGECILKIASDATRGKVTGAGVYAAGKKVALRATPAKGFVFAGWYGADGAPLWGDGGIDWRTPSITYAMPGSDVTVHARFIPAEEDGGIALSVNGQTATEAASGVRFSTSGELSLALCVSSASLPKVAIWGLPAGLKFTAKRIRNKDGSVLAEANTVYGTATRPGIYVVTAKLTNATVKKAVEFRFTVVVDNLTGANEYLRITDMDGRATRLRNGPGEAYEVTVGVEETALPSIVARGAADKVTLSGLPSGLKYDAKTGWIMGIATRVGTYTVTATVKSGKSSYVSTFTIEVEPLPDWAVGTFTGVAFETEFEADSGIFFTVTVSSQGKCACRGMTDYDWANVRGLRLSRNEEGDLCVKAEGYIVQCDPDIYWELELAITPVDLGEGLIGRGDLTMYDYMYGNWIETDDKYPLWQDVWNRPNIPSIDGQVTFVLADYESARYRIGLRFGKKGAVTASLVKNGQAVSVATTGRLALHSVDGGWWQGDLPLILSSKDGEFGALLSVTVSPDGTVSCKVEHFERNPR